MINYALSENREKWLRHPAMGDPSFDTFEKVGQTVHKSQPPYEWAVNGSLFVDFDGTWYLYGGLYGFGYYPSVENGHSHFEIFRSKDQGQTWENLGPGLSTYLFDGYSDTTTSCPDVVLMYDERRQKYLLTYDWSTDNHNWDLAHDSSGSTADSGFALAWADSPAGPFTRIPHPAMYNKRLHGHYGRIDRFYGTTVIPRKNDYLALILCDSGPNYVWGLAASTAKEAESEFSMPVMVLNADRNDYYPAPMEYYPAFVHDGMVYSPATSVAGSRNYQFLFAAPIEEAHKPEAWKMVADGSLWHSRPLADEKYGIWGQTFNGCVDKDGNFRVMYPSKDERNFGTLSVATRKWDEPYSNGFTISGHATPAVSVVRDAYRTFDLSAEFTLHGTSDILFGFHGKIGADTVSSDCGPSPSSLTEYTALRICENRWSFVDQGNEVLSGTVSDDIKNIRICRNEDSVSAWANGEKLFETALPSADFAPVGIRMYTFSLLTCSHFALEGESRPADFRYNDADALLGGGMGECNFRTEEGAYIGCARVKWNVVGGKFTIIGRKGPNYGDAIVRVNGQEAGRIHFRSDIPEEEAELFTCDLPYGRYGIDLLTTWREIPVPELIVHQA